MNDARDLQQRLTALESHLAHQNGTIEDLSDMVNKQWTEIEALRRDVNQLRERLQRIEDNFETTQPNDQPPPHY
jgi:SlyX protein|tara:strand:- start:219 stop:440 length:222 start_codon:yes stop_codon:yes gene_type:complete